VAASKTAPILATTAVSASDAVAVSLICGPYELPAADKASEAVAVSVRFAALIRLTASVAMAEPVSLIAGL
jgi:hypothetical protein